MPLKGFVDEARKTNKLMEKHIEARRNMQNNFDGIIDISEGQNIPKEKLDEIKSNGSNNNAQGNFNYIKKNVKVETDIDSTNDFEIARPRNNFIAKTDFEKEYLTKQKYQSNQSFKREIQIGSGTGLGSQNNNNLKQKIESKHGNIIANVIRASSNKGGQKVPWQECKYLKKDGENLYCKEFHCFCKKDACPFSCK